jgi:DNA-directed RNA polymerase specialized sigma24 family protein
MRSARIFFAGTAIFGKEALVKAVLGSTGGGRPNFVTTQWGLITSASAENATESRTALEALYRTYCYPVYAFIRRRGYQRQDAQDLTQDFFVHLLEKGTLARADQQRGRFRSFLLGALNHFLAHAEERTRARKRGGGCQFVYLDDDAAEKSYQLAAPEGITAGKIFEARWVAALIDAALLRLRSEFQAQGNEQLFAALQPFLVGEEETSYQQIADNFDLTLGGLKTKIHRMRARYRELVREEVVRTVAEPNQIDEELRSLRVALSS